MSRWIGAAARESLLRWSVFVALLLAFILVPFVLLEGRIDAVVQQAFRSGASLGVIALAVVALLVLDIVLPVPSSFVLSGAGFLLGWGAGSAVGFLGLTCASLAGYALGRYAGVPLATRIVGDDRLTRFAQLMQRHGALVLVGFRAVPVAAEATAILAGVSRMPGVRFIALTCVGNAVVAALYAWVGAHSADQSSFLFAAVVSIALPVLIVYSARRLFGVRHSPSL